MTIRSNGWALAALSLLSVQSVAQQPKQGASQTQNVGIHRTERVALRSREGREYHLFIAQPEGPEPPAGFPVLYLLDGNAVFGTAVEMSRILSKTGPVVVVGVGYPVETPFDQPRRYLDYTPVTPPERFRRSLTEAPPTAGGTGGHEIFFRFIQDEVKPAVAKRFKIDPTRQTLFGHSLAGLFVLHTLFAHPEAFQSYVAASPSIWWNDRSVLEEEKAFEKLAKDRPANVKLLVTVGEMEQKPPPGTPPERAEFLLQARMGDNAKEMVERLVKSPQLGVRATFVEFPGEHHGSVIPVAVSRAVRVAQEPVSPSPR